MNKKHKNETKSYLCPVIIKIVTIMGKFELINLPYEANALEPIISAQTIGFHHGKHLQGYVNNLNAAIAGTPFEEMPLEEIVKKATGGMLNNAGFQVVANRSGRNAAEKFIHVDMAAKKNIHFRPGIIHFFLAGKWMLFFIASYFCSEHTLMGERW